jgi:hypothetical protein
LLKCQFYSINESEAREEAREEEEARKENVASVYAYTSTP